MMGLVISGMVHKHVQKITWWRSQVHVLHNKGSPVIGLRKFLSEHQEVLPLSVDSTELD